ncbi:MAG: AsmA family protein [Hyphomicrobiales bacterium]
MFRRLLLAILVLIIGAGLLGYAALTLPGFESWRQKQAQSILSEYLEREVKVAGKVDIYPDSEIRVVMTDITINEASWTTSDNTQKIGRTEFSIPLAPLLKGEDLGLNGLVFESVEVNLDIDEKGQSNYEQTGTGGDLKEPLAALTGFLASDVSHDFSLRDLVFNFRDVSTGWSAVNKIEYLTSKETSDGKALELLGKGKFNGAPVAMNAKLALADEGADDKDFNPFEFEITVPGSQTQMTGVINIKPEVALIKAKLDSKSDSIGDLLDTLEVARSVEGTGGISGNLEGPLNVLAFTDIAAEISTEGGDVYKVSGGIENTAEPSGIDISFSGTISPPKNDGPADLYHLTITGFSGKISGGAENIVVKDFNLETNAFDADLREIGPISVAKVSRDAEGRIGLEGVKVLAGPIGDPYVEVDGSISDALELQGLDFQGKLDVTTAAVLGFDSDQKARDLGRLSGEIAFTDKDGDLGLEYLKASVSNSKLIALDVELVIDDIKKLDDITFVTNLDIGDLQKFATALDTKIVNVGPVKFSGKLAGGGEKVSAEGTALFGKTSIKGAIEGTLSPQGPQLSGSLSTPLLHLSDVANASAVQKLIAARASEAIPDKLDTSKFHDATTFRMNLNATKIDGAGKGASNFHAKLLYKDKIAHVDPLRLRYLGGQVNTNVSINMQKKTPHIKAKGTFSNWNIGNTLKQLGLGDMLRGIVQVHYNISTAGESSQSMLKSLNGKIAAHVSKGSLGTRLVDLSGMNLPAWLFSKSAKKGRAQIECAVLPMNFKNGRATINPFVLETHNVQIVGKGNVDFRKETVFIEGTPHAKRSGIAGVTTPFKVTGSLSDPKFQLQRGAGAAKVVGETVLLPLNLLGTLFSSDVKPTKKSRNAPCKPIKTASKRSKAKAKPAKARPKTHNFSSQNRHKNRTK